MLEDETYRPGNLIIGGGGRGVRTAPAHHGIGEWEVLQDEGDPIREAYIRKRNPHAEAERRRNQPDRHPRRNRRQRDRDRNDGHFLEYGADKGGEPGIALQTGSPVYNDRGAN